MNEKQRWFVAIFFALLMLGFWYLSGLNVKLAWMVPSSARFALMVLLILLFVYRLFDPNTPSRIIFYDILWLVAPIALIVVVRIVAALIGYGYEEPLANIIDVLVWLNWFVWTLIRFIQTVIQLGQKKTT